MLDNRGDGSHPPPDLPCSTNRGDGSHPPQTSRARQIVETDPIPPQTSRARQIVETGPIRPRSLCSAIVETGASLHELLQKEAQNREDRNRSLQFLDGISRNLDSSTEQQVVERAVSTLLNSHADKLSHLQTSVEELKRDESNLISKTAKKKAELDRCHSRLAQLNSVRPGFMDEYERLEEELQKVGLFFFVRDEPRRGPLMAYIMYGRGELTVVVQINSHSSL